MFASTTSPGASVVPVVTVMLCPSTAPVSGATSAPPVSRTLVMVPQSRVSGALLALAETPPLPEPKPRTCALMVNDPRWRGTRAPADHEVLTSGGRPKNPAWALPSSVSSDAPPTVVMDPRSNSIGMNVRPDTVGTPVAASGLP